MPVALRPVPPEFAQALLELGLAGSEALQGVPLPGGVSSDIWCIESLQGPVCAKRALPKLRVAADWSAPIERNRYEARWMQVAGAACPGSSPRVLGQHAALGVLVFFDIRLEPYLVAAASKHTDLAPALQALVVQTQSHKHALVLGDVSPKNILVGPGGPVLVDAECAWWGDPAFDLAFCLNHLLLKCLWTPTASAGFLGCFDALAEAYLERVDWEARASVEQRAAGLLPGLFLARVDGKSPVEYLTSQAQRNAVRRTARALLMRPVSRLADVRTAWQEELDR